MDVRENRRAATVEIRNGDSFSVSKRYRPGDKTAEKFKKLKGWIDKDGQRLTKMDKD